MNNISNYLDWRGDLSINTDGFNEIDNLVLSVIAYMDFNNVVPTDAGEGGITLSDAVKRLCELKMDHQDLGLMMPDMTNDFVKRASETRRFGEIKLYSYVDKIDEQLEMQFSAITFLLPDKSLFVAFRGTDDTLVGWKENFNMSFASPVPAQVAAVEYLLDIAYSMRGRIRIGGHSKGGNLAIWAAVNAPVRVQRRIVGAYNNDGPGFEEKITERAEYKAIADRLFTFVPESSVVGMLLEHTEDYEVVKSSQTALFQHDPFSWKLLGTEFIKAPDRSSFSKHTDTALRGWISSLSPEERQHSTEVLFSILESTGAKTLSDITDGKLKSLSTILKSLNTVDKKTKDNLFLLVRKMLELDKISFWK